MMFKNIIGIADNDSLQNMYRNIMSNPIQDKIKSPLERLKSLKEEKEKQIEDLKNNIKEIDEAIESLTSNTALDEILTILKKLHII